MSQGASRLGRGLNSLIRGATTGAAATVTPESPKTETSSAAHGLPTGPATTPYLEIHVEKIKPNPRQPRSRFRESALEELSASIKRSGVLQPLIVRARGDEFELIAGERRWRAARMAGLTTVPAIVRESDDAGMLELAMIENLQREDLGPLERARGYQAYVDAFGVAVEALAVKLGESRANIANYLRLLKLHAEIQGMLDNGELAMGQARALAGLTDPQRQLAIARLAVRRNLSVRQVEELVRKADAPPLDEPVKLKVSRPAYADSVERELSRAVGASVRLLPGKKKNAGRIVIEYRSLEEFDHIAEQLGARSKLE